MKLASSVALAAWAAHQPVASARTAIERGRRAVARALRKWLAMWASGRGRNSTLMRGAPRKRFSLAETRARRGSGR